MKLLTYKYEGRVEVGVLNGEENGVYSLKNFGFAYETMNELIDKLTQKELEALKFALENTKMEPVKLESVEKLAPIPNPRQDVICLGINYLAHAEESARYKQEAFGGERPYAVYFSKRVNEALPDGGRIPSHQDLVDSLDYEVELAVIIGKEAKNVSKEEALEYVFGYTIINDVSARNIQTRHKQWYFGKSLDGFTPMGPWIATADAIKNPHDLSIQSFVNGELRQDSNTSLLIFNINHVISELSQGMTLKPGTIIAMGTPAGVGMGFTPPRFLKPGDEIICTVEGIGSITNRVD